MSAAKKTILSIDDAKAVHAFLDRSLSECGQGFEFIHALSVKDGLAVLEKAASTISLVMLDWEMPEISGPEGLPMILKKAPGVPVVMVTTKNKPEEILQMLERGASEYIMKPFTPDILFEKLKTVLGMS